MNFSHSKKQKEYIENQVASGDFQNFSEEVKNALRLHKIYHHKKLIDLKLEIQKGWGSPDSNRTVLDIIKSK